MSSVYSGGAALKEAAPESREEKFEFTASGSEYFRIWIVNVLLTIVTLGIYSAWAKVRTNQYFYANTRLAGGGFEYHAKPGAILKGRIIAAVMLGAYNIGLQTAPAVAAGVFVLWMAVMPWMLWKSLQFALYNSSYRGIRFSFRGSAKGAYFHYLVLPLLGVLTLGLLYPFVHQRVKRFQHTESRYGNVPFSFDAPVRGFYKIYLGVFGMMLLAIVAMTVVSFAGIALGAGKDLTILMAFAVYPYMLVVMFVAMTALQNLIWNHTYLAQHRFRSTMTLKGIAWLYITNTLGILFTLGLFIPFATVRAANYRLACTSLVVEGSLDDITAGQRAEIGAIGESAADLGGFDLAL
ncbi:YjgN family protein [Massilia sp. METH4]|uniref:YjgN family protein n=1 Tax=Massilia sp. METH4 TaxID=3123041 RepID=UPI0030CF37FC